MAEYQERITIKKTKEIEQALINAGYIIAIKDDPKNSQYRLSNKPRVNKSLVAEEIGISYLVFDKKLFLKNTIKLIKLLKEKYDIIIEL